MVVGAGDGHVDPRRTGVLDCVGESLLHNSVGSGAGAVSHGVVERAVALIVEMDLGTTGPHPVNKPFDVFDLPRWFKGCAAVILVMQESEHAVEIGKRGSADLFDVSECVARAVLFRGKSSRTGLHHNHIHRVTDGVVKLESDTGSLVGDGPFRNQ
jgi:hypothetical protein